MANTKTSTIAEAAKSIAAHILAGPLADSLRAYNRKDLEEIASGESERYSFYLDFIPGDEVRCSLNITFNHAGRRNDEEGNQWQDWEMDVDVTWPCYGKGSTKLVRERLSLFDRVTGLAESIEDHFKDVLVTEMTLSKEQLEQAKEAAEFDKRVADLKKIVTDGSKGMRVGSTRRIDNTSALEERSKLMVEVGSKTYQTLVLSDSIIITRIS